MPALFTALKTYFSEGLQTVLLMVDQLLFALDTMYLSPYLLLFFSFGLLFFFALQVFLIRLHLEHVQAFFQKESASMRNSEKHIQRQLFVLIEELRQHNTRKQLHDVPAVPAMPSAAEPAHAPSEPVDLRSVFRREDQVQPRVADVIDSAIIPASVMRMAPVAATSAPKPLHYSLSVPTYFRASPPKASEVERIDHGIDASTDKTMHTSSETRNFLSPTPIFATAHHPSPFHADSAYASLPEPHEDENIVTETQPVLPAPTAPMPSMNRGVIEFEEIRRQMRLLAGDAKTKEPSGAHTSAAAIADAVDPASFAFVPPSTTAHS